MPLDYPPVKTMEDVEFAYRLMHLIMHRYNPIAVIWIGTGRWQKLQNTAIDADRPLEIRVHDGEDPEVVAYGIVGALQ